MRLPCDNHYHGEKNEGLKREAHFRKNTVHLVYQDFCTKAQEVKVLGKDDSAVDTSELRYEVVEISK